MKSLWDLDVSSPGYAAERARAGVVVIGAGLTGLLTAWRLCQEGRDVLVLEAREVGSGTSGHTTAKITSQHRIIYHDLVDRLGLDKAHVYADANQWAVQAYLDLITQEGIDCNLDVLPAYVYSDTHAETLQLENDAAVKLGLPSSLEPVSVSSKPALCFRHQAQFHPKKFMFALADRIVRQGGAIAEHTRVIGVDEGSPCTITTERGIVEADYVVYATLFPILDHSLYSVRLKPILHHGIAYSCETREFDGMFIGVSDISFRYHEDFLIVVGGDVPMGYSEQAYSDLDRKARARFAVKEEKARWSAHDHQPPESVPFIGPYHPGSKQCFAATGFKAWGITHAMVAARLLSDMIAGRDNPWAYLYFPGRIQGSVQVMAGQAKTAIKHLVKGGKRCPHMGCSMRFNEQDRTYDCPCHGSRFSSTGDVLWGPAVKGIDLNS